MTAGGSWLILVGVGMFILGYVPQIIRRIRGQR